MRESNPISIIAKDYNDFAKQVSDLALSDIPEGTHYFHISAKLLNFLINGGISRD